MMTSGILEKKRKTFLSKSGAAFDQMKITSMAKTAICQRSGIIYCIEPRRTGTISMWPQQGTPAAMITASGTMCRASRTAPAKCDPLELRPCAPVIIWSAAPSAACCAKLREQKPCLGKYTTNPDLSKYIYYQNCKKVAAACMVV